MLELSVLEQFLGVLPPEIQAHVRGAAAMQPRGGFCPGGGAAAEAGQDKTPGEGRLGGGWVCFLLNLAYGPQLGLVGSGHCGRMMVRAWSLLRPQSKMDALKITHVIVLSTVSSECGDVGDAKEDGAYQYVPLVFSGSAWPACFPVPRSRPPDPKRCWSPSQRSNMSRRFPSRSPSSRYSTYPCTRSYLILTADPGATLLVAWG